VSVLQGKVAVITGSAKGIGRQVALAYAREGAKIVLADVDQERLNKTQGELTGSGAEALAVMTDVRTEDQVRALMDRAAAQFGGIDILVNDAGIVPHFNWGVPKWPRIRDMEWEFWKKVQETNLGGTFLCTKHALPYIERRGGGHVINLHGGGGERSIAYVTTKESIRYFTRYVAEEERAANICLICVSPGGAIATEDAPLEARQRLPGPETLEEVFLLAAMAGMEWSGKTVQAVDGKLVEKAVG
jgi:3-oxoacyl-[acyl-carrier protein] reductase